MHTVGYAAVVVHHTILILTNVAMVKCQQKEAAVHLVVVLSLMIITLKFVAIIE